MALIWYLILTIQIILVATEPIDNGRNVGTVKVHNNKKIVVNPGKYPYVVHLEIETHRYFGSCGGVLLKRDVVLTAAHCIDTDESPKITTWLGILDTNLEKRKGQKIPVKGFTVHRDFVKLNGAQRNIHDIALLWLKTPAQLDGKYIKLASLPGKDFNAVGRLGWIVGWGGQSCGKKTSMLQKAEVRGVSSVKCQEHYKQSTIVPTFICVLADNQKATSTNGDSGGPFIIRGTVVGISSYGAIDWSKGNDANGRACDAKKPAVYTYVPKYIDWIQHALRNGPKTSLQPGAPPKIPPLPSRIPPPPPPSRMPPIGPPPPIPPRPKI